MTEIVAPMLGTAIGVAAVGDPVRPGKAVVVIESMKIECPVELDIAGTVSSVLVRHVSRLFVVGANLRVPTGTIILRKGYGLGSMTMAGGGFKAGLFCVAWPTGEIGGMGLEGAIRLGYRKELAAIADPGERERTFDKLVGRLYEQGKALAAATTFELDDVIDPADSRRWITSLLTASPGPADRDRRTRFVDPW